MLFQQSLREVIWCDSFLEAVRKSTDFASKCIQHSVDIDAHPHMGLCFEPLLKELRD